MKDAHQTDNRQWQSYIETMRCQSQSVKIDERLQKRIQAFIKARNDASRSFGV